MLIQKSLCGAYSDLINYAEEKIQKKMKTKNKKNKKKTEKKNISQHLAGLAQHWHEPDLASSINQPQPHPP